MAKFQSYVAFLPHVRITRRVLKPLPYKRNPVTLGEHLHRRRLTLGLFHPQAAERIGTCVQTYGKWEREGARPAVRWMPAIIAFLGYDPVSTTTPATLGDQLAAKRRQLGLTRSQAAKLLGVNRCTIRAWELGENPPERKRALLEHFLSGLRPTNLQASGS